MVDVAIRLSPSGPEIENAAGGQFQPGTGARLRLSEAQSTCGSTTNAVTTIDQVIGVQLSAAPVSGNEPMIASLDAPSSKKNYRATLLCDVMTDVTTGTLSVTLGIQTSPDGSTWTTKASNTHYLADSNGSSGAGGARQVRLDLILKSGASLGVTDTDTVFAVRGIIRGSEDGITVGNPAVPETGVGTCYIAAEELF